MTGLRTLISINEPSGSQADFNMDVINGTAGKFDFFSIHVINGGFDTAF